MTEGEKAMATIVVFSALYDAWAIPRGKQTISAAVYANRRWTRLVGLFLALHFEKLIPTHLDPLRRWWR